VEFYHSQAADPDWLRRASEFHGHLGPWLVIGSLLGQDAVTRLQTPGQWKIDVTCWMPPDKQRTPFSCILDGLQVSSGATLGKQNIRFDYLPAILEKGWPVVQVIRLAEAERPAAGCEYRLSSRLYELLERVVPERLEEHSRQLARERADALFIVRSMTGEEIAETLQRGRGSQAKT
jgi:formylmethanofuran dehydrogenase subunit E